MRFCTSWSMMKFTPPLQNLQMPSNSTIGPFTDTSPWQDILILSWASNGKRTLHDLTAPIVRATLPSTNPQGEQACIPNDESHCHYVHRVHGPVGPRGRGPIAAPCPYRN